MYKKLLLLFTLTFIVIIFSECCKPVEYKPSYYIRKQMHIRHAVTTKNHERVFYESHPITVDTLVKYLLEADFEVEYTSLYHCEFSDFLINKSYASQKCDDGPGIGWSGSREKVTSLTITSNADFDDTHKAGTPLNEYFYSEKFFPQPLDSVQFNDLSLDGQRFFRLTLNTRPVIETKHNFTLEMKLSNGDVFSRSTAEVTFKK